ncbi:MULTISPECIES: PhzF family phenazine biosynthesis protein [Sphingobium]|jgi:predicted PhzF superfamily epimerase YddE/YHI9|uniref:PhzF family phenazine biosynthesis protein n=1 Tax=Sphingobium TaxID=165695 RepID=UPI000C4C1746|nr:MULTISPECIES: PhzF family phenazine biosynthesis protein [Sphingobium]MAX15716.1 PhzF family phenazine biosynthesis protein [Sphingobium sp.]MEC9018163.1 PhzF family phenazine biosynthesis protein [Pseudomonadota bacterium]MBS47667.1 PhzF family phenazine biosynthesis protein [Sphingobium sp.]MCC4255929.1 PhzF family phenazine biosynthesis protein [Sphingobium lactosutens]MEE2742139.1 PhzF family phenazine biosynthesis protein [Pseudomonadota bacterium]
MSSLPFTQVDAFADAPFTGNPAAVMPLDAWLDDETLQAIAQENNLSETAFTIATPDDPDADYALRWFTPTLEVKLCGHATLASGHVLMEGDAVRFRTRHAGILTVSRAGQGYALSLPAWTMTPRDLPDLAEGLGGAPIESHWRDGGYSLFLFPDEAAVRALTPDFATLRAQGDVMLIATAPGTNSDIVSRVFVPGGGVDEDPVTGSAHCLLTPFWKERLGKTQISAVQASARGGRLGCALEGDRVILTGACRTVIEGRFLL